MPYYKCIDNHKIDGCLFSLIDGFFTLKFIAFKKYKQFFFSLLFLSLFVLMLPSINMDWSQIFSREIQFCLFSFIWLYFNFVTKFFLRKRT